MTLPAGAVVDGRFTVEASIGVGGMSEVYRVRHRALGSVHALKVLHTQHPSLSARLLQEGRIQAQLRHPNVIAVTDVVEHDGAIALLMEFADPFTLGDLLSQQPPTLEEALGLFAGILAGVRAAHAAGVLHRDLKPSNILLPLERGRRVPKVTDFGIAKLVDGDGGAVASVSLGTPGYMAPEQILGQPLDVRADLFALGVLLYALVAVTPPFPIGDPQATLDLCAGETWVDLSAAAPGCPPALAEAVRRCLAYDPADRPASCEALAAMLADLHPDFGALSAPDARVSPQIAVPAGTSPPTRLLGQALPDVSPGLTLAPPDPDATLPPRPRRSRLAALGVAIGAVGLLMAIAGALLVLERRSPPPERASLTPAQPEVGQAAPAAPAPDAPAPAPPPVAEETALRVPPPAAAVAPAAPAPDAAPAQAPRSAEEAQVAEATASEATASAPAEAEEEEPVLAEAEEAERPAAEAAPAAPPSVAGRWSGTANRRPLQMVLSQRGAAVEAEITFLFGTAERSTRYQGTIDAQGGLLLREEGGAGSVFRGQLKDGLLNGTYGAEGSKALPWSASLGG